MDIGTRIKELREKIGISQSELARRAGISQSGLSYLESGEKSPSIETLLLICDSLGISLPEFLFQNECRSIPDDLRLLLVEAEKLHPNQRKLLTAFISSLKE